ncbi:MAG: SMC-Scp complex subunit ScpB [Planctomycetota bacterium]|nr:SMC-Scp complex subunit ScpB [Planctomycetota bacterium]
MTATDEHENPTPGAAGDADASQEETIDEQVPRAGAELMPDEPLAVRLEALLISSDRPLTEARLGALLGLSGSGVARRVREALEELNGHYEQAGRAFRVEAVAGGWQILTHARFGPLLARLHQDRQQSRLSQAALETLAIVAYRQPIIRAEIEAIRGVSCGEVLRGLLERRLIKIVGRAEELGRPMLYGTTRRFLKVFGLAGLDDLPEIEGIGGEAQPATAESGKDDDQSPAPEDVQDEGRETPGTEDRPGDESDESSTTPGPGSRGSEASS